MIDPTCMIELSSVLIMHCTAGRKADSTSSGESGASDDRTSVCSMSRATACSPGVTLSPCADSRMETSVGTRRDWRGSRQVGVWEIILNTSWASAVRTGSKVKKMI
jgi:hypothetical protein